MSAPPAIEEFVRVLGYRKFGFSPEEIAPFVDDLASLVTLVRPGHAVRVAARDPTDNVFLAIALKGRCTALVSGDHHLLEFSRYRTIRILSPAEFVRSFQEK